MIYCIRKTPLLITENVPHLDKWKKNTSVWQKFRNKISMFLTQFEINH